MAVAENAGAKNATSGQNFDSTVTVVSSDSNDLERSKPRNESLVNSKESKDDDDVAVNNNSKCELQESVTNGTQMQKRFDTSEQQQQIVAKSVVVNGGGGYGTNHQIQRAKSDNGLNDMSDLVEILSNLNPMAKEFVPPSLVNNHGYLGNGFGYTNNFPAQTNPGNAIGNTIKRKKNSFNQGRRRMNTRTSMAQREDVIRRTVYVSDIDQQVTEEQLAGLFVHCGQVVDCRICGDPNSVLRFAFIEFTDEEGARAALNLSGTVLGFYPLRVLPSKTAIAPVNPTFLPRSEDEREMCARTVYCTNIDKKVTQADVRLFFESFCGEVQRLRLLGDYHHSTRIAFVEFTVAESAILALNCSGAVLGSLPIRVSPSKTPVRPRIPRSPLH
ncbi:polyadenylate-binding protein-interacting protein 12 [Ricinus communis]|uniref:RNA-binding protein, putative n=1 Tax=Ricinus communis TaxID=3988 RepID=B9T1D4_RICCO|nr:polyadenylate-binding protein-interacting protein 12 [Ricinus communis]EEF30325.1 RNA-binding protein, putative [Ricinus communis]|eukprot:XP_002532053.1 polyadenylate-binding protein-interacting protein 12 [Ricinus communis]